MTRVIRFRISATLLVAALGFAPAPAQEQTVDVERLLELHHTESEQVRLVLVPVLVTRGRGRIVKNLKREDFRLLEDSVPQEIRYFGAERNQSISLAFLLDISGSMGQLHKLDDAKEAIRIFLEQLQAGDRYALVTFSDGEVRWNTEFTPDRERFLSALDAQQPFGKTALFDALAATPALVDARIQGRKAIVLITDGSDNASRLNSFEAIQWARRTDVPIYIVGLRSPARKALGRARHMGVPLLDRFARETGGRLFSVFDPADLKEAVLDIQDELRFRYVIGYYPVQPHWNGKFRRIRLETPDHGWTVHTRRGYYADP
ncbi:MAG: VWA domain-containing protein [bacterium]|nr:VWA domain-containing protein [bacterium]